MIFSLSFITCVHYVEIHLHAGADIEGQSSGAV